VALPVLAEALRTDVTASFGGSLDSIDVLHVGALVHVGAPAAGGIRNEDAKLPSAGSIQVAPVDLVDEDPALRDRLSTGTLAEKPSSLSWNVT
jgi:hypothetical protein